MATDPTRVIVTGGAGFIGSNLVDALIEQGDVVTVIDAFVGGRNRNLDGAVAAYRQRVTIAPNDRGAHFDLAEVYRAQDKSDEALVEYLAAALIDPANANTFGMIGQVEVAAGRDEQAVVMLRRAVTLDGGLLEARYALSRALLRLGRTEESQQELRAYEAAQAKAMEEQRRQFRDNQQKIDDVLKTK